MKRKQILIYDDEQSIAEGWVNKLEKLLERSELKFEVGCLSQKDFEECITQLEGRRQNARKNPGKCEFDRNNLLDNTAILILDYDYLSSAISGENVAYLARCYSKCGIIVGLNQFRDVDFDLTLKGHPESFADLNIIDAQLANPGLWLESNQKWPGFRPWVWPILPQAIVDFERRVKDLVAQIDEPIFSVLGFPDEIVKVLPRSAIEFIAGSKGSEKRTFSQFVLDPSTKNGLRGKDKPLNDEAIARIAAARISKWLERLVLPGQDILVDAPHLIFRYPSLLKGDKDGIEVWNEMASLGDGKKLNIDHRMLTNFRYPKKYWLSRPAWFWQQVSNHEKIEEVKSPWSTHRPDWVFCEDVSRFLPRDAAREFVADLSSPFVRRFVVDPKSRSGKELRKTVKDIVYQPLVRFSL